MRKLLYVLPVAFIAALFFGATLIFAQQQTDQSLDYTLTPYVFNYTNKPGDVISDHILIRNNTSTDSTLTITVKKLQVKGDGSLDVVSGTDDPTLQWVKLPNTTVVAKSQAWTEIPFTVTIPQDAGFGYYWAIVISNKDIALPLNATGAKISGEGAVPILLNVEKKGALTQVEVVNFKADNFINEYLPVNFTTTVKNTGNIHVQPKGTIFISNKFTKDLAQLPVKVANGNVLPEQIRQFTNSWGDGFITRDPVMLSNNTVKVDGTGKQVTQLNFHWEKLSSIRLGLYTANLVLVVNNGKIDIPVEATATFWVIPYTFIIVTLIVLIGLVLLIRFILKLYIAKEVRKQRGS